MTDERQGKPSASGVERLHLCPGSWQLERTLPRLPETEDAASGTRIHAALAGVANVKLSDAEEEMHDRIAALCGDATELAIGTRSPDLEYWEERMWLGERFSGKADLVIIHKESGIVLDAKTGRNEVTTAEGNAQLRALAVLLDEQHTLNRIVVGIIQPWANEPISLCEYTREDLSRAKEWLISVLDAAEKPDAPRIPSEKACRYCRAKAVCPEARSTAMLVPDSVDKIALEDDWKGAVVSLSSTSLSEFLTRIPHAEAVFGACRDEAKRRLQAGEEVPGWRLKEGATKEVITDLETVHQRFIGYGGTTQQYLACLSATKGKLESSLKEVTGYKGKELKAAFESLVQGCVEAKQNAPSLERVK